MPYKRRTYKRKRRYHNGIFKRHKRRYAQARSNKAPVPTTYYTKLRYSESINRTIGVGQADYFTFRANSVYAPTQTISGHQPRGFDQLMLLYNQYTVVGARITVTAAPNNADGGDNNFIWGLAQRNSITSLTSNLADYTEGRNVKSRMLSNGLSTEAKVLSMNMNIGKYLGVSKPLSDNTLSGNASANPLTEAYFVLFSGAPTAAANEKIQYYVNIDYSVVFTKPKVLPIS